MTSNRPRAVLAGHADVAHGLVSAVQAIAGRGDRFVPLSNAGLGADTLLTALRELVTREGATVIFTDLPAGSATLAARRLQREQPALTVVAGVNLAALLEFAMHDEPDGANAIEKGRAAMLLWPGGPGAA
jgi:PTS system N-acetylgalactosamine-specific IIA component